MKSDICSLITVGGFRYVQHAVETGPHQNPDHLVSHLLDAAARQAALEFALDRKASGLAAHPFYNYLLLRTRHYDDFLLGAIEQSFRQVLIVGAGTDTRAYRFSSQLRAAHATVIESDLAIVIQEKVRAVAALGDHSHVRHCALDLREEPDAGWLERAGFDSSEKTLILMEGVSPYVPAPALQRWLAFFSRVSAAGALLCCDYKWVGYDDSFGRSPLDAEPTVRLRDERDAVLFHQRAGWMVRDLYDSEALARRYRFDSGRALSCEDVISCAERVAMPA